MALGRERPEPLNVQEHIELGGAEVEWDLKIGDAQVDWHLRKLTLWVLLPTYVISILIVVYFVQMKGSGRLSLSTEDLGIVSGLVASINGLLTLAIRAVFGGNSRKLPHNSGTRRTALTRGKRSGEA